MPTYAYACTQCGHRFDAVQSFSDAALTECPECGGVLRKQYAQVNELSSENATLQRKVSNRGRIWFLVPLGIIIGMTIQ